MLDEAIQSLRPTTDNEDHVQRIEIEIRTKEMKAEHSRPSVVPHKPGLWKWHTASEIIATLWFTVQSRLLIHYRTVLILSKHPFSLSLSICLSGVVVACCSWCQAFWKIQWLVLTHIYCSTAISSCKAVQIMWKFEFIFQARISELAASTLMFVISHDPLGGFRHYTYTQLSNFQTLWAIF